MSMTLDDALAPLGSYVGGFCTADLSDDGVLCYLFDIREVPSEQLGTWLGDTFGDGFLDGYLADDEEHGTQWVHPTRIPFALVGVEDSDEEDGFDQQFEAILLFDLEAGDNGDCPVLRIEVDGTAYPDDEPSDAGTLAEISLTPP